MGLLNLESSFTLANRRPLRRMLRRLRNLMDPADHVLMDIMMKRRL